jgi:hypothetical protein
MSYKTQPKPKPFIHGRCHLCRFFVEIPRSIPANGGKIWGECRRYPPVSLRSYNDNSMAVGQFLGTHQNDWCGEFKAKPK